MRISELARSGDVPVATVKYYLREGLLPAGRLTSATQAQYDHEHVGRLRLVRALLGSGLSVAAAKDVLARVDGPTEGSLELLAETQEMLTPAGPDVPLDEARALVEGWGWHFDEAFRGPLLQLARALQAVEDAGFTMPPDTLPRYAEAMTLVGEVDIANVPMTSTADAVRYVVLGTVLMEPVLLALRRLAEADAAVRRFTASKASSEVSDVDPTS